MIKKLSLLLAAVATLASATTLTASEPEVVKPNYNLAEQFSPAKIRRMVPQTIVRPNWFKSGDKFWYKWQTRDAITYYVVTLIFASTASAVYASENSLTKVRFPE